MTTSQVSPILEIPHGDWHGGNLPAARATVRDTVEQGGVLYFHHLDFPLSEQERALLDPAIADPARKNISLEPNNGALHGVIGEPQRQQTVRGLVARYQTQARALVDGLFPEYDGKLRSAPTSLRLHQVETRATSWRKDDSRLHIDAFPSRPTHGERILRVFLNLNPHGIPRVWRVGEEFEHMAQRFLPRIPAQLPGSAWLQHLLHVTKSPRTPYDHIMLHLHDAMKADLDYQKNSPQVTVPFPPGSIWACFSDHASHAVMSGQFMMEQTFFLPVQAMVHPEWAPLGILERLKGKPLV